MRFMNQNRKCFAQKGLQRSETWVLPRQQITKKNVRHHKQTVVGVDSKSTDHCRLLMSVSVCQAAT